MALISISRREQEDQERQEHCIHTGNTIVSYIIQNIIIYVPMDVTTVMNAMSISTALFIYLIYYLEMTRKTQINHILSQSQFQTRQFSL